jgi:hypothetical protein
MGHGKTMSSASTLGKLAYTYREQEEKPRGMRHINDQYVSLVKETRKNNDSRSS